MLDNKHKKFKDLDMNLLIGGPLKAACEAQILLSKATADFINNTCMNDAVNNNLKEDSAEKLKFGVVKLNKEKLDNNYR